MASLVDPAFWRGRRVLLTGHTGFKGGWCALWLQHMGAQVFGYALAPETDPSLFQLARIAEGIDSSIGDIRDPTGLRATIAKARPQVVLHMAAQPLVRRSVREPLLTFDTNVMGTAQVLDALRAAGLDPASLPDGAQTRVGDLASDVSAGQRRRVALARVMLAPAPLVLLDEPTAGLDDATEADVVATVRRLAEAGSAVVVVAHRPSLVADADEVVELAPVEHQPVEVIA